MTLKEIKLQYWHDSYYRCGRLLPLSFCSFTIKGDSEGVGSGKRATWDIAGKRPSRSVERVGGWIDDSGMGFGMCLQRKSCWISTFKVGLLAGCFWSRCSRVPFFIVVFKTVPFETCTVLCFIQFYSICSASIKHRIWVQIREVLKL